METCPACSRPLPSPTSRCPSCGHDPAGATRVDGATSSARTEMLGGSASTSSAPDGAAARFVSGTIVAGRYRIVGLLGRGGMGEVYRADDLKLGQSVALKFLPRGLERDPVRLQRFLEEVRTARQVAHPNVCRVYDVDEAEGQHYLTMEYVDGEDLASLLRRIGRLPEERAVEVARQICAGLGAVHAAGVLHRDLKPANVMLDGRGRVRLTDFGLASAAARSDELDSRAGTPAYMAPEQLAGQGVSVRSDLYALGLVLYELFTGHPVYEGRTVEEITALHASSMPSRPSHYVQSLDPAVERVVLRCLERDPSSRPESATEVAAGLPGGDPLAAALAAGETPSPELVAAVGTRPGLAAWKAVALALVGVALVVGGSHWVGRTSLLAYIPFEKRPEVLQDRARELVAVLGYTEDAFERPVDTAWGWLVWRDVIDEVARQDSTLERWGRLRGRPDAAGFWYRQSVSLMRPEPALTGPIFRRGPVDLMNPAPVLPGDLAVVLDLDGTLRRFETLPRRFASEDPAEPDWDPLFEAAGIDRQLFEPVAPRYQRYMAPDLRRAWVGPDPEDPSRELRIEAGAWEGRVVLFNVATSASLEALAAPIVAERPALGARLQQTLPATIILVLVLFVAAMASRNAEQQRVDGRGARRLGGAVATLFLVASTVQSPTVWSWAWADEIWPILVGAVFIGSITWALYLAAEPLGRRVWPTMFVSSSRLLSRPRVEWRDSLLGRSVLVGLVAGGLLYVLFVPVPQWIRQQTVDVALSPFGIDPQMLLGDRIALAKCLEVGFTIGMAFVRVAALVALQRWVRRRWLAVLLAVIVWTAIDGGGTGLGLLVTALQAAASMFVLLRWGVLAFVVAQLVQGLAWRGRTFDFSHWTSEGAWFALGIVALLAAYGVWAATARTFEVGRAAAARVSSPAR